MDNESTTAKPSTPVRLPNWPTSARVAPLAIFASFRALGAEIAVGVTDARQLALALGHTQHIVERIDRTLSRFRRDSELSLLEQSPNRYVPVSPLFWDALDMALRAAQETQGWFDPTVRSAIEAAGYDRSIELIERDGPGEARPTGPSDGWRRIQRDATTRSVLLPAGVRLDFGGIGKGLAVDLALQTLPTSVGSACVNAGGDLAVVGAAPKGGWIFGLAADAEAAEHAQVALYSGALATSGLGRRQWRRDGSRLHHLIDPHTGRPGVSPWRSVSVAAATCATAEVAAKVAWLMGDAGPTWIESLGFGACFLATNGAVSCCGNWPTGAEHAPTPPNEGSAP